MPSDDLIREFIRMVLNTIEADNAKLASRIKELESEGTLIVSGGLSGDDDFWEITNYRSGKILAEGREEEAYEAKTNELARKFPGGIWHIDRLWHDLDIPSGIPPAASVSESLAGALYDWIESRDTPDKDIAEWAGLPAEKVHEIRAGGGI